MLKALPDVERLLETHGFAHAPEWPFPNDGWSGSQLTLVERGGRRAILKRTSARLDWIVRATDDHSLREASVASGPLMLPEGVVAPYLGVARDGEGAAMLMPDLSVELIAWTEGSGPIATEVLDLVLARLAALHGSAWWPEDLTSGWCPLGPRIGLLNRGSAANYRDEGLGVGDTFLAGWDAFDRRASPRARELVATLSANPSPLVERLASLPRVGLHGDVKLANVALMPGAEVAFIDWQMTLRAPVAVELGWLLVSNVALLPESPEAVLERYHRLAGADVVGDWGAQVDLTWIVGLLLRGWRKGLDAESGTPTGWGAGGSDDLAWWCERAVAAADRL